MAYGSIPEVKRLTSVQPRDLGFEDDEGLDAWIQQQLDEVADLINRDRNRDFEAENGDVPLGIHHIASRMAANIVQLALARRDSPIVRIDEFAVDITDGSIFTEDIVNALSRYPAKPRFRFLVAHRKTIEKDDSS